MIDRHLNGTGRRAKGVTVCVRQNGGSIHDELSSTNQHLARRLLTPASQHSRHINGAALREADGSKSRESGRSERRPLSRSIYEDFSWDIRIRYLFYADQVDLTTRSRECGSLAGDIAPYQRDSSSFCDNQPT